MIWSTIGRMLAARWLIIAAVTSSSLIGGLIVVVWSPPLYEASARVMLNIYRPDPITGARLGKRTIDPFIATQLNLIRDFQVIVPAITAAGWLDDPNVLQAYNDRAGGDGLPLEIWAAQNVISALQTDVVDDTNILEISYRGASPEAAELVTGTIRDAYITASINERRYQATDDADRQVTRLDRLRLELQQLQERQRAVETETGVLLGRGGTDMEASQLMSLARPSLASMQPRGAIAMDSSARAALSKLDLEIAMASESLGPNHPRLLQLKAMRGAALARTEAEERDGGGVASAALAYERATQTRLDAQKSKVLGSRLDVLRIRLAQDQVKLKEKAVEEATKQIAYSRQLSTVVESGITSVGPVEVKEDRVFPSIPLILGGTGGIGLLAGILIALQVEMLDRRVRNVAIMRNATGLLVLGTVPPLRAPRVKVARRRPRRLRKAMTA